MPSPEDIPQTETRLKSTFDKSAESTPKGTLKGTLVTKLTTEIIPVSDSRDPSAAVILRDTMDVSSESKLPTFDALRPEPLAAKIFTDKEGKIDLRLSSTDHHQDGVAYNPDTDTVVVCDGLGGIGPEGDLKNFFGFALAHATAEVDDISKLSDPATIKSVIERTKTILSVDLGIEVADPYSRIKTSLGGGLAIASTVAAVQRMPGTERWRIATIGDSSIAILDRDGHIRRGFGEAFQLIAQGRTDSTGAAEDVPMSSIVGMAKGDLGGGVRYGNDVLGAQFAEVELHEGERIVAASDAYVQKTPPNVLERDVALSAEDWLSAKPRYGDDTTLAVISR